MNYRNLRMGKLIREELGKLITRELEFDGALPTITEVEVNQKLETATIKIGVLPSEKAETVLKILHAAAGRLQHFLIKKLNLKPIPRIRFELDPGPESAAKVEKILLDK